LDPIASDRLLPSTLSSPSLCATRRHCHHGRLSQPPTLTTRSTLTFGIPLPLHPIHAHRHRLKSLVFWSRASEREGDRSSQRRGARTLPTDPGHNYTPMKPMSPNQRMRIETSTATPVPEQREIVVVGAFPWYVWREGGRDGGSGGRMLAAMVLGEQPLHGHQQEGLNWDSIPSPSRLTFPHVSLT
jgi:hypothetical protein